MRNEPVAILRAAPAHWVGDGFPVRTLFSYDRMGSQVSPFLLLDYAGPVQFAATVKQRGVGEHPHRGFETVTLVYQGEVAHRDTSGSGGVIGPGDVQWMTAGRGVLHEEFHSTGFAQRGGLFKVAQLWVNLPAAYKMTEPGYQAITAADIPVVTLPEQRGTVRVVAGSFQGVRGPARTFTELNLWDTRLSAGPLLLPVPDDHQAIIAVLEGAVRLRGNNTELGDGEGAVFAAGAGPLQIEVQAPTTLLVMSGVPIDEPVVGYGPFVMNTREQIMQAIQDVNAGRFGRL